MTDNAGEYELVTPFVLVRSNGGPYDDASFVAGSVCGGLFIELEMCATQRAVPRVRWLRPEILPQVDLIAMKYGYRLIRGDLDEASGYQNIGFDHADTEPEERP